MPSFFDPWGIFDPGGFFDPASYASPVKKAAPAQQLVTAAITISYEPGTLSSTANFTSTTTDVRSEAPAAVRQISPALAPLPLSEILSDVPKSLRGNKADTLLFRSFWPLAGFSAMHENDLNKSPVRQDAQLERCVGLSLAIARDYLRGFDMAAREVMASLKEIKETTREMAKAGADLNEFPYNFCATAESVLKLVHARIEAGKKPTADLREILIPDEYKAPPLEKKKPVVKSALSRRI